MSHLGNKQFQQTYCPVPQEVRLADNKISLFNRI